MSLADKIWGTNVQRIQAKLTAAQERVTELTNKRNDLSLSAALDDTPAAKQLDKVTASLAEAERSVSNLSSALAQAQSRAAEEAAAQAAADEDARQAHIKSLLTRREKLVGNAEDAIIALSDSLKTLTDLDKEICALVGGPMLTTGSGPNSIGWYTNASRILNFNAFRDRLLYFARPRLTPWLDLPNHGVNPFYKDRSLRDIERDEVAKGVYNTPVHHPMDARPVASEESALADSKLKYTQTALGWKRQEELHPR